MAVRNLILWRHAEAEVLMHGHADMARALTKKGHKQARQMAAWLRRYLPRQTYALVSPALRTRETAQYWGEDWQEEGLLAPDQPLQPILQLLEDSLFEQVMLVGHQPWLGELAAQCLGMQNAQLHIQKGAIWWLRLPKSGPPYKVYCVQAPDLLA